MQKPSVRSILAAITFVSASSSSPILASPASLPAVSQEAQDIGICSAPTSWARTDKILTCSCPANFNISTSLWGTDIYTADSYICTTALHASVLDRSGGRVTIQMLPGQNSYAGTKRNGVSTRSYGKYTASYRFVNSSARDSGQASASGQEKKKRFRNPFEKMRQQYWLASVWTSSENRMLNLSARISANATAPPNGAGPARR